MTTRNRNRMTLGAAAILLAAAGFWAGKSLTTATLTPTAQTGTVALVGINGDEFAIRLDGQRQLTSYGLGSNTTWRDAYGIWQDGTRPGCWIECPSRPVPRYPIVTPPTPSG